MKTPKRSRRSSTSCAASSTALQVASWLRLKALFALLAVLAAAIGTSGCAHHPAAPTPPPAEEATGRELLNALRARANYWSLYQARLAIRTESSKGRTRFQAVVSAKLPDAFRLEASNPFGQTAGLLIINSAAASLWIPSERVAYTASQAQTLVGHFLGIPIPPDVFAYGLLGCVPPNQLNESFRVSSTPSTLRATSQDPRRGLSFVWEFSKEPLALISVDVHGSQEHYTTHYDPPVEVQSTEVPPKNVSFSSSEWRMDISLLQAEPVPDLQSSLFVPITPAGVRTVDLDRVR